MDQVEISLITCGPGEEVWSLYGHTAIRYHDEGRGQDLAINYGMFSFAKSYFILRFVFGLTDYEMGIEDFGRFLMQYQAQRRWVRQQQLNLTRMEKWRITQFIDYNYRPENRVYRYNYFYDNCTTRARDMIVSHLDGEVDYAVNPDVKTSYREMIHQWNATHPWARFGNDLLLGVLADKETSNAQQQFLPDSLRKDFDNAVVIGDKGSKRPLVGKSTYLIPPMLNKSLDGYWITPYTLAFAFLAIMLTVMLVEWRRKTVLWGFDALVMCLTGLAGVVLLAMIFSQHPTVRLNYQILLLNPLSLLFVWPAVKKWRNRQTHWYHQLWSMSLLLFMLLGFFQTYADTMIFLAQCLIVRFVWIANRLRKLRKAKSGHPSI